MAEGAELVPGAPKERVKGESGAEAGGGIVEAISAATGKAKSEPASGATAGQVVGTVARERAIALAVKFKLKAELGKGKAIALT